MFKGSTAIAFCTGTPVSDLISAANTEGRLHLLGGIVNDQMFTPKGLKKCADLPPMETQHLILTRTLTMSQSALQSHLAYHQQTLSDLLKRMPEKHRVN